ncbi:hypothetical protein AB6A40_011404 [Gnathostoma spinigerum]|uniref:Histone-binding protein RBBP4-like N-terminal domain-containing protein n=1 Tax=Gnathostoma spinigerum TaxID=75299 RepID=A0ABD6EXL5_9BILA
MEANEETDEEIADDEDIPADKKKEKKAYIPGVSRPLRDGEEWEYDPSAYKVYHTFSSAYPCMSFDPIMDKLGDNRREYPLTLYLVSGTQADRFMKNQIIVMKASNISSAEKEEIEDSENEDDSSDEDDSKGLRLYSAIIPHFGTVNRIRVS